MVKVHYKGEILELTGVQIRELCEKEGLTELKDYTIRESFLVPTDKVEAIENYRRELSNGEVYRSTAYNIILKNFEESK